jgi:hypothetical protein
MRSRLWLISLPILSLALFLTSCSANSDNGVSPSNPTTTNTDNTSDTNIVPGQTECDSAGDVSPDGQYVCAGRGAFYWVSLLDLATNVDEGSDNNPGSNSSNGYWTTKCATVEYPNPNYDARRGFSAVVNEPTVRTQECSQVWVQE